MIHCLIAIFYKYQGYHENRSYWYAEEIPFVEAAEIGTEKVIKDHATIGIVVTSDGSFGELKRENYIEAEEKVISELKVINKPFIVILNTTHPNNDETKKIAQHLHSTYDVPVLEIKINMPEWIAILNPDHQVKQSYIKSIKESVIEIDRLKDIDKIISHFLSNEMIEKSYLSDVDPSTGIITVNLTAPADLYNKTLTDIIKIDVKTKLIY